MMTENPPDSDAEFTYEQAREQLIAVVQRLESGGTPLAESLALWEQGERLAAACQRFLDGAQAKVDAARRSRDDPPQDDPTAEDSRGDR